MMDWSTADFTVAVRERVETLGYELVDLRRRRAGRRTAVQVRIDRPGSTPGNGVTVEDCASVSRSLETWLDTAQILGPRYVLEVSSPGIERPIRWKEHWARFAGMLVNVRLRGRGRLQARIVRTVDDPDGVVLRPEGEEMDITVPLDRVQDATLVVDWSAIDRAMSRRTAGDG